VGPLLFLVGATASGKKKAALAIAEALPVELLSLDSMKVYRGMDLGTDKEAGRRFALVDLAEPSQRFSVGAYVRAAQAEVASLRARGRLPLFVGGTGLYLRALVEGLFVVPDVEPTVRAEVQRRLDAEGSEALHAELARVDPRAAARLHPRDRKRIARALEVWSQTGRPLSEWQAESTRRPIEGTPLLVGIRWSRPALRARIAARVERMFAAGLVEEARALFESGRIGPVAGLAIGYREVAAMLRDGTSPEECRRAVVRDTTTFVRRQENWFQRFPQIRWVEADRDPESVPRRALAAFQEELGAELGRLSAAAPDRPSRS
jgi:tRNA dimethylallyltransferase